MRRSIENKTSSVDQLRLSQFEIVTLRLVYLKYKCWGKSKSFLA
jgi:hypothetical protein